MNFDQLNPPRCVVCVAVLVDDACPNGHPRIRTATDAPRLTGDTGSGAVTGETITDEQIRDLYNEAWQRFVDSCNALGFWPPSFDGTGCKATHDVQSEARARCADILNARKAVCP